MREEAARPPNKGFYARHRPAAAVGTVFQPRNMNDRPDLASARQGKVEIDLNVLAQLEDKARRQDFSLFAYLAHILSQETPEIRRKGRVFE
jgi:hypothetical protein